MTTFRTWTLIFGLSTALLMTAGCKLGGGGGGGGGAGLFDGSGSGGDIVTAGLDQGGPDPVATIHHPEPASMALFGGGLAGLAILRSRPRRKRQAS